MVVRHALRSVVVWVHPDGAGHDDNPISIAFQRVGDHVDRPLVDRASKLESGDRIEVEYTEIKSGTNLSNRGRSIEMIDPL